MDNTTIIIILTALAFLLLSLFTYFFKKIRFNKMCLYLQSGAFKEFFALANSKSSKFLFAQFNIEYLKLNANILQGKEKQIEKSFQTLFSLRMGKKQKEDIYMKAFNYYVGLENQPKCKEVLDVILTFSNPEMIKEAQTIYDIFILKQGNYIEEMETSLVDTPEDQRGITEYLLSVQYGNLKDKKKEKEYLALSKKHLKAPAPK